MARAAAPRSTWGRLRTYCAISRKQKSGIDGKTARRADCSTGQNILTDVLTASALLWSVGCFGWCEGTWLEGCHPGQPVTQLARGTVEGISTWWGTALIASTEGLLSADLPTSTFVLKLGVDVYQSSGDRVQRFCFPKRVCDSEKVKHHRSQVSSTQSYCAAPKGTGLPIPENGMNQDGLMISGDLLQAP